MSKPKPYMAARNRARALSVHEEQLTRYRIDPETGCWLWTGGVSTDGYGKVKRNGKTLRAHRLFYEHHIGPIPEGRVIMHTCDTPLCVNPLHLKCGTHLDNERDKDAKGRRPPSPSITHPESIPRGENNPRFGRPMLPHVKEALRQANLGRPLTTEHREKLSPLTREEALEILMDKTSSEYELAAKYGVARSTIWKIRNKIHWGRLTLDEDNKAAAA